jgi:hypothetical protein
VGCGLVAALSGLWMTQFYALPPLDGTALYAMRWRTLFMGLGWAVNLAVAEWLIARRPTAGERSRAA